MQPIRNPEISKSEVDILKELGLKEKNVLQLQLTALKIWITKNASVESFPVFRRYTQSSTFLSFPSASRIVKMIKEFSFKVPEGIILNTVKWRALGSKYIKRFFQPMKPTTSYATMQMYDILQQNPEV